MKEIGPREKALREMREARLKRNSPNPFEDAARGRDVVVPKSSGGGAEGRSTRQPTEKEPRPTSDSVQKQRVAVVAPSPPEAKLESSTAVVQVAVNDQVAGSIPASPAKKGRPKAGETRAKPWEAEGISKASWYRRRAK